MLRTDIRYAHRGLHEKPVIPENSLAAFARAIEYGFGCEFDVHLMKDGNLAVIHDASLLRTTGIDKKIEDLSKEDLINITLEESNEHIPLFEEVLDLFDGRVPLVIECKCENGNHQALSEAVCRVLDEHNGGYKGDFCIESFDPRCILWFRGNRPEIARGQLTQNFMKRPEGLKFITRVMLTLQVMNLASRPHFTACRFEDRNMFSNRLAIKLRHAKGFLWTITTSEQMEAGEREGFVPIFEQFIPNKNTRV